MLKRLAVVLVCLAAIVAIGSSGAFSAVSTDRGVSATVVEDENAYVGVVEEECTITNQFPTGTTLDLTLTQDGEVVAEESIENRETFDIETTGEAEISAVGSDGAVRAEMTREFDCLDQSDSVTLASDTVRSPGASGNVEFDVEATQPVELTSVGLKGSGEFENVSVTNPGTLTVESQTVDEFEPGERFDPIELSGSTTTEIEIEQIDPGIDGNEVRAVQDPNSDDQNVTIEIVLEFTDGTQTVIGLEAGEFTPGGSQAETSSSDHSTEESDDASEDRDDGSETHEQTGDDEGEPVDSEDEAESEEGESTEESDDTPTEDGNGSDGE